MFVSGNNSIAGLEAKLPKIHVITDPNELRLKKGQWFVKTHEIVKPLSKCSRARLLAKIIFKTLFSLGFCWLAESTKREASFFKEKRKVVPIYSPLESLPKKAEPKPAEKQDDNGLPEDVDFEGEAQPDQLNKIPPPLAELNLDGCQNINDNGLAYLQKLNNLKKLDLPNDNNLDKAFFAEQGLPDQIAVVDKAKVVQAPINQGGGLNPANAPLPKFGAAIDMVARDKALYDEINKAHAMQAAAPIATVGFKMGGAKAGQGLPGDMPFGQIPANQNFHQFAVDALNEAKAEGGGAPAKPAFFLSNKAGYGLLNFAAPAGQPAAPLNMMGEKLHLADAPLLQNFPPFNIAAALKVLDDGVKEAQDILAAAAVPMNMGGALVGHGIPGDMLPEHIPTHAKVQKLAMGIIGLGQAVQGAPVGGLQPVGDVLKADPDVVFQVADFAYPIINREDFEDVRLAVIIAQNPHITSLDLSKTHITEKGITLLKTLKHLRELDLSGCEIGDGLKHIAGCKQLKSLILKNTAIKNEDLNALNSLKKLQHLDLSYCGNLTVSAFQELQECKSIESLNLSHCKFHDFWFPYLSNLPLLRKLNLSSCTMTPLGLSALKELNNLQELDLTFCKLTNEHMAVLKEFKSLQALILKENGKVTLEGFVELGKVTSLKKLMLSNCKGLNVEGFAALKGLTGLQELDLNYSLDQVTDECLAQLSDLKDLRRLNLHCCCKVTDAGLAVIKNLEKLEELDLSCNAEITDVTVSYLKGLKHLRKLSLMSAKKVTDAGMADLGSIESLETLDLTGLTISDAGIAKLVTLKNLQTLILDGCSKIGVSSLETLKMMPALKHAQLLYTKISPQEAKVLIGEGINVKFFNK